ncbi:hypothetical protein GCM10009430_03440 [Aquimarina litoralis]|uniref:CHAT domain-containing protein n=1 Tax=Aquimarina litoralis TaxID=584605 RepID=A0ABP3TQS1_9FLAO
MGQTSKDTVNANLYQQKGDSLVQRQHLDSAIIYYQKSADIYKSLQYWKKTASSYNKIASVYLKKTTLDSALHFSKKAFSICESKLEKNNIEKANSLENIGWYYYEQSEFENALRKFKDGLKIKLEILPENHIAFANAYNNLGRVYSKTAQLNLSLNAYQKALQIAKNYPNSPNSNIGLYYNNVAGIFYRRGEYDEAIETLKKAIEFQNDISNHHHPKSVNYYNNLGNLFMSKGDSENGLKNYKIALNTQNFIKSTNKLLTASIYNNIGNAHNSLGNFNKALTYHKKSLTIRQKRYGELHYSIASSYMNIGNAFSNLDEITSALENYTKSQEIYEKIFSEEHPRIAQIYGNKAIALQRQGNTDEALNFLKKTLNIYTTNYGNSHPKVAKTHSTIAWYFYENKLLNKALFHSKIALDINKNLFGKKNSKNSELYNFFARVYIEKKMGKEALDFCEKAIIANSRYQKKSKTHSVFNPKIYFDPSIALMSLKLKANSFKLLFDTNKKIKDLQKATQYYQKADSIIHYLKNFKKNHQDKVILSRDIKEIYKKSIEAEFLSYKVKNNPTHLIKAFEYSEKSKANTLKNLLTTIRAKTFAGLSKETLLLEQNLKTNLAFYTSNITNQLQTKNPDTTKIRFYENKIFDITRKQDSLTNFLEQNHPNYYRLKYKNTFLTVPEIQERLSNNTTILEFFTTDSVTYAFTLNKNDINVSKIATPNIAQKIQHFREHITSKNIIDYKNNAESLYGTLIKPIVHQLKGDELIIVPDGPLWHLNFDLLLTEESTSKDPKQLPYMLRDYAISYANSVNVLFSKNHSNNNSKLLQECLAFSFSDSTQITDSESLSFNILRNADADLPGTREEISAISEIVNGQYYYGAQAIEKNFKKAAHQYNILHLALHGEVDNEHPENSKLYFTKSNDSIEDDLLYSHELFALDIPAELVVLSACNTGTGKIAEGEGIMSLGNAFQYAGSKSLLLTNWEVPDQNTPEIMRNFYTHLSSKMSKSKALQQAKLDYLKNANITRSHPFYWGSFYLLGNNKSIDLQNPFSISKTITWFVLLVLVLCLTFFVLKKKKKAI